MTIADKLTTIAGIKTDIRTAINGKGGSLTSGSPFSAYSAAISSLPSGGGGYPPDWSQIGYTGAPQMILDAFSYAKTVYDNWDPTVTSLHGKFSGDTRLVYMPMVETSGVTNMQNMFSGCTNLSVVPLLNTSACTSMDGMFYACGISSVPAFNTSACTNMSYMFYNCSRLTTVPQFDTSSVTDMSFMFNGCSGLTTVPLFDTSSATNMSYMFNGCKNLTAIPQFDTSNVTNMAWMLRDCSSLTTLPQFDSSSVNTMAYMFYNCNSIQKITSLDMSKCTDFYFMLGSSSSLNNLRFMLLKGLGTPSAVTSYLNTRIQRCPNWGVDSTDIPDARQSLVDSLLTYSFDRAAAGYATCTIQLSSDSYNQLTAQELADIQAKGYSITR